MADATCTAGKKTLSGGGAIAFNAPGNAFLTHIIPTGAASRTRCSPSRPRTSHRGQLGLHRRAGNLRELRTRTSLPAALASAVGGHHSSRLRSAARNCAASAPSSARWSHDMQR